MNYRGTRVVVSGDYKRVPDPTCAGFVPVSCDVFVTEATFALPVFRHPAAGRGDPPAAGQRRAVSRPHARRRLLRAGKMPAADRAAARRPAGTGRSGCTARWPRMCAVYEALGVQLGDLRLAADGGEGRAGRRHRAGPARRDRRPLGAPPGGPGGGAGLRLDAGAPARQLARRGTAAGDLRPRRLGRVERHAGRGRRAGGLGDARARGGADPRRRPARHHRPRPCACSAMARRTRRRMRAPPSRRRRAPPLLMNPHRTTPGNSA